MKGPRTLAATVGALVAVVLGAPIAVRAELAVHDGGVPPEVTATGESSGAADAGAPSSSPNDAAGDATTPVQPLPAAEPAPLPTQPPAGAPPALTAPQPVSAPQRVEELTVVGTREVRTAGSAHVVRPRDLERLHQDNPEAVVKTVPGVYARGEDGFGLRPNIGIRGTSPDRSKKVTLMEDGILFGPAPYAAPAAYYFPQINRMELVRVIKGPGAISYGPQTVGGAIDFVTRGIPVGEAGFVDAALGQYGYGLVHGAFGASAGRSGYVVEGVRLQTSGFKQLDGGGDTGFEHNEWMWKGRYLLSTDPDAQQEVGLKLGYSDEDSRETYLGLTDADARATPMRRYRASALDRMQWHRTQLVASYRARWRQAFTLDVAAYRHDLSRTWRKVNHMGTGAIADILADPTSPKNAILYGVLTGAMDSADPNENGSAETIYIGPNRRQFVSQGVRALATWQGRTGPLDHRVEAGARLHYDRVDRLHTEDGFLMRGGELVPDGRPTITTSNQRAWATALALHLTSATTWGRLTVTPGARVELISTTLRDRQRGTEVDGAPQRLLIPGVGAYAALTPSVGVLAGVYRGFSPALPGLPGTVKPEVSVNTEVGVRFTPRRLRLEAIGFFNDYSNLTSVCSEQCISNGDDRQTNAGQAHIYGLETFARADVPVTEHVLIPFSAAYTYTRARFLQAFRSEEASLGDVAAGDEMPFVPRHQAHVTTGVDTPRGSLILSATYVSAMREHAGQGPLVGLERRTDESLILDGTVRVPVSALGQVYLSIRNLTNAHDIASRAPFGARPVAPRWIQVGTKWNF